MKSSKIASLLLSALVLLSNINVAAFDLDSSEKVLEDSSEIKLSFNGNVEDSSKNKIVTKYNGSENYIEGVSGQAIALNGVNNYLDLGTSEKLQPENLTVSTWINPSESLKGREHLLVWNKPNGNYNGNGWYLSVLDSNTPLKLSIGSGFQEAYVNGDLDEFFPLNTWTHIAVTFDENTKKVKIYRNGVSQKVNYVNNISNSIIADSSEHKYIGFNSPNYDGGYAKLALDEFEIFSSAISASEVVDLYTTFGAEFDEQAIVNEDINNITIKTKEVTSDLYLPTEGSAGSKINWQSSNEAVISNEGKVTRPKLGESDTKVTLTATAVFGEKSTTKEFEVMVLAESDFITLKEFKMEEINVLDSYYNNAFEKEIEYLKEYQSDKLLAGFLETRGLEPKEVKYPGWEDTEIRGHTMGHFLTAISQAYENTKDSELLETINYIVSELERSQFENGYLSAFPETLFDNVENSQPAWVPWYTMHKIIAGLIDVYKYTGNQQAYEIVTKLGDWVYNRTSKWTPTIQNTVLSVEYGGMNDCLYELYKISGNDNYVTAAHMFDEIELFTQIQQGNDILNGKHANTTIPKFLGALNRYVALGEGEEFYLEAAESFWDIVVNNHTYVTGGNSEWEHFGAAGILDEERTNCNCETCNTYNMLKLSRELFKLTGKVKYADYYENTLINAILSSQNPESGMTTYFQPMATGYFKVFGSAFNNFWCCTGTGMENFTKLNDSIYFYDENNNLYVNQYVSSVLTWEDNNMKITQNSTIPEGSKTSFTMETIGVDSSEANIKIRVPDWIAGEAEVTINGEKVENTISGGYLNLNRTWHNGDVIEVTFPMKVVAYNLPDNQYSVAFKYGPVVLSAALGTEDLEETTTGVSVSIPTKNVDIKDFITVNGEVNSWLNNIEDNLVRNGDALEFTLRNTDEDSNLVFTPHFKQYKERYGLYWNLVEEDSEVLQNHILTSKQKNRREEAKIDSLPVGNDQYELEHNIKGENTSTATYGGYNLRHAWKDGWFSYEMKVNSEIENFLLIKYYSGDYGRTFDIYIDDELLINETLENVDPGNFYDKLYEIPAKMVAGKEKVTVKFVTRGDSYVGGIFDVFSVIRAFDTNPNIKDLSFSTGQLSPEFQGDSNAYTLYVPVGTTEVKMKAELSNKNGLLYVGDILIDDTTERNIALNSDGDTVINLLSKAEDHETAKEYTITIKATKEPENIEDNPENNLPDSEDDKLPNQGNGQDIDNNQNNSSEINNDNKDTASNTNKNNSNTNTNTNSSKLPITGVESLGYMYLGCIFLLSGITSIFIRKRKI